MNLFCILWRIWYYVLIALVIILLFPFILVTASRPDWHRHFFWFARLWGKIIVLLMGWRLKVTYESATDWSKPAIIIANHASELDIMATLAIAKGTWLFIGKKELARFPVFGSFYKRTNILVDRSNPYSRRDAYRRAHLKISKGFGVCIYPEGGIPDPRWLLAPFKPGAFRLAVDAQIPIIPITFVDNKRRFPNSWFAGSPGTLRCVVHKPMITKGPDEHSIQRLRRDAYKAIARTLKAHMINGKEQDQ